VLPLQEDTLSLLGTDVQVFIFFFQLKLLFMNYERNKPLKRAALRGQVLPVAASILSADSQFELCE
jgi:hypothetical protein